MVQLKDQASKQLERIGRQVEELSSEAQKGRSAMLGLGAGLGAASIGLGLFTKSNIDSRIQEVLDLIDLTEFKKRMVSDCSGGMQRRCSLAVALLHNPEILILDEPTVGVDPELRIEFWNYFKQISKERGVTILITTHYLAESINCDRIGLMNKRILVSGSPIELMDKVKKVKNLMKLPDMEEVFIHYTHQDKIEKKLGGQGIEHQSKENLCNHTKESPGFIT